MFFTILYEGFHGNKIGFVTLEEKDLKTHLLDHLDNWDVDYTEEEIEYILKNHVGHAAYETSKAYVEVQIYKISPGKSIDL